MAKRSGVESGCGPGMACQCRVEALVSIDARGQMILPKDLREKAGIQNKDKLAVLRWEGDCACGGLLLIRADRLAAMATDMLGPLAQQIAPQGLSARRGD